MAAMTVHADRFNGFPGSPLPCAAHPLAGAAGIFPEPELLVVVHMAADAEQRKPWELPGWVLQ